MQEFDNLQYTSLRHVDIHCARVPESVIFLLKKHIGLSWCMPHRKGTQKRSCMWSPT